MKKKKKKKAQKLGLYLDPKLNFFKKKKKKKKKKKPVKGISLIKKT